jgi:hypothetical protein
MVVAKPLLGNNILCRKQCLAWVASVYSARKILDGTFMQDI